MTHRCRRFVCNPLAAGWVVANLLPLSTECSSSEREAPMESEPRQLAALVARAAQDLHVAGQAAAKAHHVDLMFALAGAEVLLDEWNQQLTYDCLEAEEALRSQLKSPDIEAPRPGAALALPF